MVQNQLGQIPNVFDSLSLSDTSSNAMATMATTAQSANERFQHDWPGATPVLETRPDATAAIAARLGASYLAASEARQTVLSGHYLCISVLSGSKRYAADLQPAPVDVLLMGEWSIEQSLLLKPEARKV